MATANTNIARIALSVITISVQSPAPPGATAEPLGPAAYLKGLAEERNITVVVASHAWRHIKRLGLRRLAHHTHRSKDGRTTETVVNG